MKTAYHVSYGLSVAAVWWRLYKWRAVGLLIVVACLPLAAVAGSYTAIKPYERYVLSSHQAVQSKHVPVGLVLGAGVDKATGQPYKELRSRLDVAAAALQHGDVQKLILSGDNRFVDYDEPTAMKQYLIDTHNISPDLLQTDFAGRSTYESCERAAKVFNQDRLVLFSAGSHLPRAIYLCRHLGIETYGVASDLEANNAVRREALARVKAVYNIYIKGEKTIYGPAIPL